MREYRGREMLWKDMEITVMWKLINCTSNKIGSDRCTVRKKDSNTYRIGLSLNIYILMMFFFARL